MDKNFKHVYKNIPKKFENNQTKIINTILEEIQNSCNNFSKQKERPPGRSFFVVSYSAISSSRLP